MVLDTYDWREKTIHDTQHLKWLIENPRVKEHLI